jgi:hypothetical protein
MMAMRIGFFRSIHFHLTIPVFYTVQYRLKQKAVPWAIGRCNHTLIPQECLGICENL